MFLGFYGLSYDVKLDFEQRMGKKSVINRENAWEVTQYEEQ